MKIINRQDKNMESICITRPVPINGDNDLEEYFSNSNMSDSTYKYQMPNWLNILKIIENNNVYGSFRDDIQGDLMHRNLYRL